MTDPMRTIPSLQARRGLPILLATALLASSGLPALADAVKPYARAQYDVLCVAGCDAQAPQLVQRIKPALPTGPLPEADKVQPRTIIGGVWCYDGGGCVGIGTIAPHRTEIGVVRNTVSIWSW